MFYRSMPIGDVRLAHCLCVGMNVGGHRFGIFVCMVRSDRCTHTYLWVIMHWTIEYGMYGPLPFRICLLVLLQVGYPDTVIGILLYCIDCSDPCVCIFRGSLEARPLWCSPLPAHTLLLLSLILLPPSLDPWQ